MIDASETLEDTSIGIRAISHTGLDRALPELALLLRDVVNDTGGLGFLPPMADDEALNYWLSIRAELRDGAGFCSRRTTAIASWGRRSSPSRRGQTHATGRQFTRCSSSGR